MPISKSDFIGQTAKKFSTRFIEPGLVAYEGIGIILVKKEILDNMANSFIGKPVFNEMHKKESPTDFTDGIADGIVTAVHYNPSDGWYWADFLVWDEDTIKNCENGYSVSCKYTVLDSIPGGIHNNIDYVQEVTKGVYTHLAIVDDPRYEGALIIANSKGESMKLAFWKKDSPNEKKEIEVQNGKVQDSEGKEVDLQKMIELYNSQQKVVKLLDTDLVDIGDGEKVSFAELKNFMKKDKNQPLSKEVENEDEEEDSEQYSEEEQYPEEEEEEYSEDVSEEIEDKSKKSESQKKDQKELENSISKKYKKKIKDLENSVGNKYFKEVLNAAQNRENEDFAGSFISPREQYSEGSRRYGSGK